MKQREWQKSKEKYKIDFKPKWDFYWTTDHTLIIIRTVGIKS
jgi:hypothetical protein